MLTRTDPTLPRPSWQTQAEMPILTEYDPASALMPQFTWCAHRPRDLRRTAPIGWGLTEAEALADLLIKEGHPIRTDYWPKPIPMRQYDWSAVRDDYEPPMPVGYGRTEADAIADLIEQEDV